MLAIALTIGTALIGISLLSVPAFIVSYIALRSTMSVFYDNDIILGLNLGSLMAGWYAVVLTAWAILNQRRLAQVPCTVHLFVLFLYTMFSQLLAGNVDINTSVRYYNMLITFVVFPALFSSDARLSTLVHALFLATLFPAFQAMSQKFFGGELLGMRTEEISSEGVRMYFGLYHKYDGYALAALAGFSTIAYKMSVARPGWQIYMYLGLVFVYVEMVLMTISRSGFIAMLISLAGIGLVYSRKHRIHPIVLAAMVGGVISLIGVEYYISNISTRSEGELQHLQEGNRSALFHGRFGLWEAAWNHLSTKSTVDFLFGGQIDIGPHGDYAAWFFNYGLFGLLLYVSFLMHLGLRTLNKSLSLMKHSEKHYGFCLMCLCGMSIWVIQAVVMNPSHYPDYTYLILGCTAILVSRRFPMKTQP